MQADHRLEQLYAISRVLVGYSSLGPALRETFELATISTPLSSIVVVEEAGDAMRVVTFPPLDETCLAGRDALAHAHQAASYLTARDGPRWMSDLDRSLRAFVIVPLVVGRGAIFGVIQFEPAGSPTRGDVEFLNAIGNQLAIAIDRARTAKLAEARVREQLDFTRAIGASLGEGTVAIDRNGVVTFLNPAATALLGVSMTTAIGMPFDALARFETTDGRVLDCPLRRAIATDSWVQSDDHFLCREGARFEVAYTSSPIRREGGIEGAVLAFNDIRERKRGERDRTFMLDATMRLSATLDASTVLTELARVAVPTIGELSFVDVLTTDDHLLRAAWAHAESDPALDQFYRATPTIIDSGPELTVIRSGRSLHATADETWWIQTLKSPYEIGLLRQWAGAHVLIVPLAIGDRILGTLTMHARPGARSYSAADLALAEELGRRGATALEHARLYGQARDAIGLRDQMLAIVSHDLRSPLSIVMMAAGALDEQLLESSNKSIVQKIHRAAHRMDRMIRDLLDYASIDAGQLSIVPRAQDVHSMISETLVGVEAIARVRNVELSMVVPDGLPPVACDRDRILQVTSNLVGNALKVVSSGGLVTIRAALHDDGIAISVIDTGPGISAHDQGRLFERYWRGAEHRYQGTGLGLAIARGIVLAHGGKIWVESKLGHGATFTFTLPIARAKRLKTEEPPDPISSDRRL